MGSSNSGWHGGNGRPQRKARVDECPVVLTVKELERRWPLGDEIDGWFDSGIRYELRPEQREGESRATAAALTLYGPPNGSEPRTRPIERLTLTARSMPFGPDRWHFLCPRCQRLARKLYIPPVDAPRSGRANREQLETKERIVEGDGSPSRFARHSSFACRSCHNLTYESVQTHDPRISRLRGDPDRLAAILESTRFIDAPTGRLVVALNSLLVE